MKRFLLTIFILFTLVGTVHAGPRVILDGRELSFDVPPAVENGRTLVPLRSIFEALGASVQWDATTQTVTATKGDVAIHLVIGGQAKRNGVPVALDVPAKVIDGRTMVPLRFVSEAMGADVVWNGDTQTITISGKAIGIPVTIERVIDGDTVEIAYNGQKERVRLIGVDTPETVHPTKEVQGYGVEASEFTKTQLTGKRVQLEFDVEQRDRYGRLLGYIWLDGVMFNETLIKEGYAQLSTFPPNVKYVERFKAAQTEARNAKKGLWGITDTTDPEQPVQAVSAPSTGKIKGNINSKGEKIYHVPGGQFYDQTDPEEWFSTIEEAEAAGYRPSQR